LVPPPDRRPQGLHVELRQVHARARLVEASDLVQRPTYAIRLGEPHLCDGHRPLYPAVLDGRDSRSQHLVVPMALYASEIQQIEHDVLVIGAGGAGLRAAIECSAQKLSTGVISKSLLGKAHTVMAEGGMAAAMGNVDARDNWKVHFRDTMR